MLVFLSLLVELEETSFLLSKDACLCLGHNSIQVLCQLENEAVEELSDKL
jgi:hypothetical protein